MSRSFASERLNEMKKDFNSNWENQVAQTAATTNGLFKAAENIQSIDADEEIIQPKLSWFFYYNNEKTSIRVRRTMINGIEVVSVLYKESRREINLFDFSRGMKLKSA